MSQQEGSALPNTPHIQSSDIFQRLVESVTDYAIFILDPQGRVRSWNIGAERLKGYLSNEIIGQHFSIFYPAKDRAANKPAYELEIASQVGRFEDEGWRVRKGGTRFWANVIITRLVDNDENLIGFGKVTRDLTERRQSELRYRLLVEGVIDYAIYFMDREGYVASWNMGVERIKGYTADEIIGKHFSLFYTEEDREGGLPRKVLDAALANGHFEGEGWRVRKDGSRFWASVVVTALYDEEGNHTGFSKVTRDISDRKRLLDKLQHHTQELEVQMAEREQSNAELEAFAYSVSHDLRAPLRAISGFADALGEDCGANLDECGHEYLKEISNAATRMNLLVQDLLEYGRVSRISMPQESVNVLDAVSEALGHLSNEDRHSITLEVPSELVVHAPARVMGQMIINFLANALKFQQKGAVPQVRLFAEARQKSVRISVADNGIGIAPEHQQRIWNLFERLHERDAYPGTGIGLAIVKRAATRLHGSCGVNSQPGKGSTFWIELPSAQSTEGSTNGSKSGFAR